MRVSLLRSCSGDSLKRIVSVAALLLLCSLWNTALAQDVKVGGKVVDAETHEPLIGVTVTVPGTNRGAITGADGTYTISIPKGSTLNFSILGYETHAESVGTRTLINVMLRASATDVEELVVIGYGAIRKSEVTGAITQLGASEINKSPITSIDQALQGNAAGVLVINTSAEPGGEVAIRVRGGTSISGENDPLIVVDGFPTDQQALTMLNPNDVQSMEVLRDAAATAIFGSRGANGVIMVTTKSGAMGKPSFTVDIKQGLSTPRRTIPMMDAEQFIRYAHSANLTSGQSMTVGTGNNTFRPDTVSMFDAQRLIIKDIATRGEYNVSLSGGTNDFRYYLSGGYLHEEGLLNNSSNDRITGRAKFTINMAANLRLVVGASASYQTLKAVVGGSDNGAMMRALMIRPTTNTSGNFVDGVFFDPDTGEPSSVSTEVANAMNNNKQRRTFNTDFNAELRWDINRYLRFTTTGSFKFNEQKNVSYMPISIFQTATQRDRYSAAFRDSRNTMRWYNDNVLNYNRKFGKHNLNAILGQSWEASKIDPFGLTVYGFDVDYFMWNNLAASTFVNTTSPVTSSGASLTSMAKWEAMQLVSFFSRAIYNWDNRYHVTASFRADGSSRFGKDNRFGYFPSISFMWNVMREPFAKGWKGVTTLRPRLSYGVTGNDKIKNYLAISTLTQDRTIIDGKAYGGVKTDALGNPDLQWETTATYNAGVELGLFKSRITMSFDAYYKKTYDLLYDFRLPGSNGYSKVMRNVGNVDNKGVEFEIESRNIVNKNFEWVTNFNVGYNKSKVTDLGGIDNVVLYTLTGVMTNDLTYLIVGEPLGTIMAHRTTIYKDWKEVYADDAVWVEDPSNIPTVPGMIRYYDRNGDGVIDDADRVNVGNVLPYLVGGLTNTFRLHRFDLTFFFNFAYGNSIVDANTGRLDRWQSTRYGQTTKGLESYRWNNYVTGQIGYTGGASYPVPSAYVSATNALEYQAMFNDYWVQDGSYIRLKTLTFGYTFNEKTVSRMGMKGLRVALTGTNLLTLTKYKGMDPEMSSSLGTSNSRLGIDQSAYPAAKMYLVNVNFKF